MENKLKAMGFEIWRTGGNCLAMKKEYGNFEILVTDESGCDLPSDESWLAGLYYNNDAEIMVVYSIDLKNSESFDTTIAEFENVISDRKE